MDMDIYAGLLKEINAGRKSAIMTTWQAGHPLRKRLVRADEHDSVRAALTSGKLVYHEDTSGQKILVEPYFPEPQLVVLGGGHIAKPLVEYAAKVGFTVTVVDDRPFFANKARFPQAQAVFCTSFSACFQQIQFNPATFVVIVTRGHRYDLLCLQEALKHQLAYIGMIGSKRRVRAMKAQLVEEGYAAQAVEDVYAPIGLEIGAVTPEEIALAIAAQLVSVRRLKHGSWPELDRNVLEELAKETEEAMAVVTVVSTKGSVPRKAGAKMLVLPDGRTIGTIGGGCGEAEVISLARQTIDQGGYQTYVVDMTGDVAEDEGMVCGGIMEVVIECRT